MLDVAGVDGFLGNIDEMLEASDGEGAVWRSFVSAWWDRFGTAEVGTGDLYELALSCEPPLPLGIRRRSLAANAARQGARHACATASSTSLVSKRASKPSAVSHQARSVGGSPLMKKQARMNVGNVLRTRPNVEKVGTLANFEQRSPPTFPGISQIRRLWGTWVNVVNVFLTLRACAGARTRDRRPGKNVPHVHHIHRTLKIQTLAPGNVAGNVASTFTVPQPIRPTG